MEAHDRLIQALTDASLYEHPTDRDNGLADAHLVGAC